jgi:polygalacturonase
MGLASAAMGATGGAADDRLYIPPDAAIVNVTDFGAKPNDGADDTEALRAAIKKALSGSRYAAPPFIYLPAGQYDVSDSLEGRIGTDGWSSGWRV